MRSATSAPRLMSGRWMDIGGDYNRPAAVALIRGQTARNSLEILGKLAIQRGKLLAHQEDMKLILFALTAALLTTGLVSAPAFAQERDNHRREAAREAQQGRAAQPAPEAQQGRAAQPAREAQQGRAAQPAPARSAEQSRPRREEAPRVQAPVAAPPAAAQAPRAEAPRAENRGSTVVGRSVPRTTPLYDRERPDRERYDRDHRAYAYTPRVYAPRTYYRPYVFRPRVSIGFGIFAGYPVPYAWRYSDPIYVYGYHAPRAPVYFTPGMSLYGGVALEMSPYDADVFVDGGYAGKVADFDGTTQPLTLAAGTHRIEVQAPGYAPLVFDVVVEGGQVIPYRGDLRPY